MRLLLVITFAALATAAPAAEQIPEPEELTIEDNFEDYLDPWLEKEYLGRKHSGSAPAQSGITF